MQPTTWLHHLLRPQRHQTRGPSLYGVGVTDVRVSLSGVIFYIPTPRTGLTYIVGHPFVCSSEPEYATTPVYVFSIDRSACECRQQSVRFALIPECEYIRASKGTHMELDYHTPIKR